MALPPNKMFLFPCLKVTARGTVSRADAAELVAAELKISAEDRQELTPKRGKPAYANRTEWAAFYLAQAELIATPKRGYLEATERGRRFLEAHPDGFSYAELLQFPEYRDYVNKRRSAAKGRTQPPEEPDKPDENIVTGSIEELREALAISLLARIATKPPTFLGGVATELLTRTGQGITTLEPSRRFKQIGQHTREGIFELRDPFGCERICLRTNKSSGPIRLGDSDIRDFVGSVQVSNASRGVFVTTSEFTSHARSSAERTAMRIDLVGGTKLAEMMMDLNVGCRDKHRYTVPEIDEDFFL